MNVNVSDLIINQFSKNLLALRGILEKARTHADNHKFNPDLFLDTKLAPDMFNFTRQVQITTDIAKGAAARLGGKTAPIFEDKEKSLEDLISRVNMTLNFLENFKPEDFAEFREKKISFPWKPGASLEGIDFLTSHAIPNFYFHMSMTYALLRSFGVNIGKGDFLGAQNWKNA